MNREMTRHTAAILDRLMNELKEMTPQLRKAARYVLDHPDEVGLNSMREVAEEGGVKPNTMVRMARAIGFSSYEDFRKPFRDDLRSGRKAYPDRARWLQSIAQSGRHGSLFGGIAESAVENVERLFAGTKTEDLKAAADLIANAHTIYVLGVGLLHPMAHLFAYLGRMALGSIVVTPRYGSLPVDDLAGAGPDDILLAMTFQPYRREVIDAVEHARRQGLCIIALTDSRGSPIAAGARLTFVLPADIPQFFASSVAVAAFLETLVAFIVADAEPETVANIERLHRQRFESGVYWKDGS